MGDVNLSGSVKISRVENIDPITISSIDRIGKIAPLATHIKEVNHIDPISIDALHVSQIKNIEPIKVERFNITDLPMLNMSVRQLPSVDMNIRRLPPVSIGTHQDFHIPSSYTIRARIFGIELFRVNMDGCTTIVPRERYRREQARTQNRSFPLTATAGNPAIPSRPQEKSAVICYPDSHCRPGPLHWSYIGGEAIAQAGNWQQGKSFIDTRMSYVSKSNSLNLGLPAMSFRMPDPGQSETYGGSSLSSGG